MMIIELALINIRNFKEAKKFLLKPGINLIHGGNGSGKSTLFNVFKDVFFPSYEGYSTGGSSQAAISFKLNHGEVYRLLRHFSKQSVQLYKLDPSANKFVLTEKEEQNIQKLLLSFFKLEDLSKEQISSIFFLDRSSLPSLNPFSKEKVPSSISRPSESQRAGHITVNASLEELKKQEAKADLLAQKESEMLDYKDKIFSIKRTINELESLDSELSSIAEKERMFPGLSAVPKDIGQIIEEYEKAVIEKNNEERQLIEEKEIIEQQLTMEQQNLLQNRFLWAGAGIVLISLLLPFFIDLEGALKQIDLIALLIGIGLALFSLIKDFNKISQKKIWNVKLENKNKNIEMLNARFQREHSKYYEVLQKTEAANREELETKLSIYRQLKEEENTLLQKKQNLLANKSKEVLLAELIEASEKADTSEREINNLKPGTKDPYVIQQEIKALEESLSNENESLSLSTSSISTGESGLSQLTKPSRSLSAFFEKDWYLFLKNSGMSHDQINQLVQSKTSAITGNSVAIQVNDQGKITINRDQETLSAGTVDQIFWTLFILRLELLKNISFPLFLDDPLITLDPVHQSLVLSSLKDLSKSRQIILMSNTPYPIEASNSIRI